MKQYQALNIQPKVEFDSKLGNENERRNWREETYDAKNKEPGNRYDWSRHQLNFEIMRGKPKVDQDGQEVKDDLGRTVFEKPGIVPLGSQPLSLKKRYDKRLKELGHKKWENAKGNQPNTCVDFVINGDHERMTEIAFGKPMGFDWQEDNSGVKLQEVRADELSEIAARYGVSDFVNMDGHYDQINILGLCYYKFLCDKFGEENVLGLECHLDETTPHFHALVIPVATKQKRGRVGGYTLVDAQKNPVLDENGKEVHVNKRTYDRMPEEKRANYIPTVAKRVQSISYASYFGESKYESRHSFAAWHTMLYEEIGQKWGLERGEHLADMTPEQRKEHRKKSKRRLEQERIESVERTEQQLVKEKKATDAAVKADEKLQQIKDDISSKSGELQAVSGDVKATQQELEKLTAAKGEVEKWGAVLFKEKTMDFPSLAEIRLTDGRTFSQFFDDKLQEIVTALSEPLGMFTTQKEWRNAKKKQVNAIITALQDTLFGSEGLDKAYRKEIKQFGKSLYDDARAEIAKVIKDNEQLRSDLKLSQMQSDSLMQQNLSLDRENDSLRASLKNAQVALDKEKKAYDGDKPIVWAGGSRKGQQLTKDEYIAYFKRQDAKSKSEAAKLRTQLDLQKQRSEKDVAKLKVQLEEQKRRSEEEVGKFKERLAVLKESALSLLSPSFKKVVEIIIQQWQAKAKEFTKDLKDTIDGVLSEWGQAPAKRKSYIDYAFQQAKFLVKFDPDQEWDETQLEPLHADALHIADDTWDAIREERERINRLRDAAVKSVATLAETPNRRCYRQSDIDAIKTYLKEISKDHQQAAIVKLGSLAKEHYNIRHEYWLKNLLKNIFDILEGKGKGKGIRM